MNLLYPYLIFALIVLFVVAMGNERIEPYESKEYLYGYCIDTCIYSERPQECIKQCNLLYKE
jgi:hypothetical protein